MSVWLVDAECPEAFLAVKVNVHDCWLVLGGTFAVYVPLQATDSGLLAVPKAGVDESEQEVAFEDEKLRTTDPPVHGTLLELRESEAVGWLAAAA